MEHNRPRPPSTVRNVVGPRVAEARKLSRPPLTQAALAARLQVAGLRIDRGTVAKIEVRYREVTDVELLALARALGVTAGWLLREGEAPGAVE